MKSYLALGNSTFVHNKKYYYITAMLFIKNIYYENNANICTS